MTCERLWQVRAIDEGRLGPSDVAAFERHARTCPACRRTLTEAAELRSLTQALPRAAPSDLEVRRLRARVLRDAMTAPVTRSHRARATVVGLAAVLVLLVLVVRARHGTSASPTFAGTVRPVSGAVWRQTREGNVERVFLTDGELGLHVRKQAPDERFLVMVPDGEVEVRGTTFEVVVRDRRTTRVHVDDGVVIVRLDGTSTLLAGEEWPPRAATLPVTPPATSALASSVASRAAVDRADASTSHATDPSLPAPILGTRPVVATRPIAPRMDPGAAGRAENGELPDYERAVAVYRAGRFEEAAERLHAFGIAHPKSPLLDDAAFLEASSLASAGRSDAAALLAERHLVQFPSSFHRKEAAILVTRLRRDRGDCDGARKAAAPWLEESPLDPRVVTALGGCRGQ